MGVRFVGLSMCSLVVAGVSGSLLLLAVGMYGPTIAAVNRRDLGSLGLFVLGAIVGLLSFAMVMKWFLVNYRVLTLSLMIGLMIGSLRALWPWQDQAREPLGVTDPTGPAIALLLGAGVVAITIGLERYLKSRTTQ